jgi:NTP pyrophosphatase (non-canonical NTP hydrolase)
MGYLTNGLSFNTLREANLKRLPTFRNKHGELAHSHPQGRDWTPAQWLQATTGELGEYANVRKKFERGDLSEAEFINLAASELADVATYLDILAFQVGVNLGDAVRKKFNAVSERVGSPVYIGHDDDWHLREANAADPAVYATKRTESIPCQALFCPFCKCPDIKSHSEWWQCTCCGAEALGTLWNTRHSPTLESTPEWFYPKDNDDLENMPEPGELVVVIYQQDDGTPSRPVVLAPTLPEAGPAATLDKVVYRRIMRWHRILEE